MPITNQAILDTASTTFRAAFDEIFELGAPGAWSNYTEIIPTSSKVNEVDILETMPVVREWTGAKIFPDIRASSFSLTVRKYEKSFAIDRLDAMADTTGLIGRRIASFISAGGDGGSIYDRIAHLALTANGVGYDGVALFSAAHPRGSGGATQSNITTTALSFANHRAILTTMQSLTDENGEPLRISPDVLMVGPSNAALGMEITGSDKRLQLVTAAGVLDPAAAGVAAATVPNVFGGGMMDLVVDPRLVGAFDDHYYYVDRMRGPKPILGYEFRAPEGIEQTAMDDEGRFMNDELRFSVECDVVFGSGDWHVAHAGIL